jgi:iron complex transport system ATP-binding protein
VQHHIVEATNVSHAAGGRRLVDAVSLGVAAGELLALVGPNGAGKSTLLGLLAGDLAPTAGEVLLDGQPLVQLPAREQALRRAVLRQRVGVSLPFTAFEIALMGRHPHLHGRAEGPADVAIARDALARTEMSAFAERAFPTLSGGEQSRASLARVLAQQAPLLLLDEPTAALDVRHQHGALQLARAVAASGGATLAVLHDLNLAALYADRIGVMHQGRLVALGPPAAVLRAELLREVYGLPFVITPHPQADALLVLAVPEQEPAGVRGGRDALLVR